MAQTLVILGLGYVGLPLAQGAAAAGLQVVGLDRNESVVQGLNAGRSHVDDLSDEDVGTMRRQGFRATSDPEVIGGADVVVICVPTPLSEDGGPDLSAVLSASRSVAKHLRPQTLVVLESTTYPGTTDEVVRPLLETSGFQAGRDFSLAFSPERIDPGNPTYGLRNTPKVVGGHTARCTEQAVDFYEQFIDTVVPARGTREAEMAKLLENTYRHVNIALVNEMARFCHELDIDLWDVISCASSKPFGFQAFRPGPGVGGHCIPIDPNYLSWQVRARLGYPFRFVELAQEINARMPHYVTERAQDVLNSVGKPVRGARVLLLGVTYKPDIADERESPARPVAAQLRTKGAQIVFHDPYVDRWELGGAAVPKVQDLDEELRSCDLAILLQHHRAYDVEQLAAAEAPLLDTRGVVTGPRVERL